MHRYQHDDDNDKGLYETQIFLKFILIDLDLEQNLH